MLAVASLRVGLSIGHVAEPIGLESRANRRLFRVKRLVRIFWLAKSWFVVPANRKSQVLELYMDDFGLYQALSSSDSC